MPKLSRVTTCAVPVLGFVLLALSQPGIARTQSAATSPAISEAQARDWAAYAVTKAAGNKEVFEEQFTKLVRILAPAYHADPFSLGVQVHQSAALSIAIFGPVANFHLEVAEAVRKMQLTDKLPWPCGVMVEVLPSQIDSPDIENIVVTRDGVIVKPTGNRLAPAALTTRAGVTRMIHKGSVCYAPSAFTSGAEVTVIAIPVAGENITKTLDAGSLRMII